MIELLKNGAAGKNVVVGPVEYLMRQVLLDNPVLAGIWISGLVFSFFRAQTRWVGWTYIVLIAMMIVLQSKDYYPEAIYPLLFATGAVALESWTQGVRSLRPVIASVAFVAGALTVPMSVPVLPEPIFVSYARGLHLTALPEENKAIGALPQYYADMHGWPELANEVATLYDSLPPTQRMKTAIFTSNYGEAAAIDFFGSRFGLPPVVCGHNQYDLWGPHGFDGNPAIVVNVDRSHAARLKVFQEITFDNPLGMPYENHMPILVVGGAPW